MASTPRDVGPWLAPRRVGYSGQSHASAEPVEERGLRPKPSSTPKPAPPQGPAPVSSPTKR